MTKTKTGLVGVTPTMPMIKRADVVIADMKAHTFSVSRVYESYNECYGVRDMPESCASCLKTRAELVRKWRNAIPLEVLEAFKNADCALPIGAVVVDDAPPALTLTLFAKDSATPFEATQHPRFETTDKTDVNGEPIQDEFMQLLTEDGEAVPAGEYVDAEGFIYHITENGRASIEVPATNVAEQYTDPTGVGFVAPALGVLRIPMKEGIPLDFTPYKEGGDKGTVKYADGKAVQAGTYETARGSKIAVQVAGKTTLPEGENPLL